jgi:hypothetical protein
MNWLNRCQAFSRCLPAQILDSFSGVGTTPQWRTMYPASTGRMLGKNDTPIGYALPPCGISFAMPIPPLSPSPLTTCGDRLPRGRTRPRAKGERMPSPSRHRTFEVQPSLRALLPPGYHGDPPTLGAPLPDTDAVDHTGPRDDTSGSIPRVTCAPTPYDVNSHLG